MSGADLLDVGLERPDLLRDTGFIGGTWQAAHDGAVFDVVDPASLRLVRRISLMGGIDAQRAVDAAAAALPAWRRCTAADRSQLLRCWFDAILAHAGDLARILTAEQGKPLAEARGEIAYAASFIEWFAEEGKRVYGDTISSPRSDQRILVTKAPVGVVAAITPWNFPAAMITRKAGAALAAGCTLVVKPSELTPLTALALAKLAEEAGLPPGVLNIVMGNAADIGGVFMADARVRKLTFTGSTMIGKRLTAACAATLKRVSMELGGNAPFIVFDDADLDDAVEGAIASKFRNTGQTCVCANRIYVQDGVYDEFAARLVARVEVMRIGSGLAGDAELGPLINARALQKVEEHVSDAVGKGATVLTGGRRAPEAGPGSFYAATVLSGVNSTMRLTEEETFGPVAPLIRFADENDAVRAANSTATGLAAYLYTRNIGRLWRVSEALESGMVGVNTGAISTAVAPFGGVKESGLGREGSKYGIEEYLDLKYVCVSGLDERPMGSAEPTAPLTTDRRAVDGASR
jgi:succinate-semialdehyde dehydrogenase/glutarate-semialdehyde dehydrogenase